MHFLFLHPGGLLSVQQILNPVGQWDVLEIALGSPGSSRAGTWSRPLPFLVLRVEVRTALPASLAVPKIKRGRAQLRGL